MSGVTLSPGRAAGDSVAFQGGGGGAEIVGIEP
jgi:hypothetical protein